MIVKAMSWEIKEGKSVVWMDAPWFGEPNWVIKWWAGELPTRLHQGQIRMDVEVPEAAALEAAKRIVLAVDARRAVVAERAAAGWTSRCPRRQPWRRPSGSCSRSMPGVPSWPSGRQPSRPSPRTSSASIDPQTPADRGSAADTAGAGMPDQSCPVCELSDGFHDHKIHTERVTVPHEKLITKEGDR